MQCLSQASTQETLPSLKFGLQRVSLAAVEGREMCWPSGKEGEVGEASPQMYHHSLVANCVTCQWVVYLWNHSLLAR